MNDRKKIEDLEHLLSESVVSLDGQVPNQAAALGSLVVAHRVRLLTSAVREGTSAIEANTSAIEKASDRADKNAATATRIAWIAVVLAIASIAVAIRCAGF